MKSRKRYSQEQFQALWQDLHRQQQQAVWNFPQAPGVGPIPAPAAWIYSNYPGFTATLANNSTGIAAINIGTSMLAVGQVVTGAGIVNNPPTTIAAITSATALTLSQATTATAAGSGVALNFQGIPGMQSSVFGNYPFYGVPNPSAPDVLGCAFDIPELQTLNASQNFTPAPGLGFFGLGAATTTGTSIMANLNGTWTAIFTGSTTAAAFSGFLMADGANIRISVAAGGTGTFTFYRLRNPTYR